MNMRAGRGRGARLAMVALFSILAAIAAPGAALAQDEHVRLALRPVDQAGSYLDLTMQPGDTRSVDVDIANAGAGTLAARTYAADVYTIINGGFGGSLRDEPRTGMTTWLDYPTAVLQLAPGKHVRKTVDVTVPKDAEPGEYIASIVLENDRPIQGRGTVALSQIVRQAIGVVVTVPGQRSPGLTIGDASHKVVGGMSIVSVAVQNTGNVRLKPLVEFTLIDTSGGTVSRASVQMDTFYARTNTHVEVPLAGLLQPGTYTAQLKLNDVAQGGRANDPAIVFVVEAPRETSPGDGAVPGLTGVIQGPAEAQISLPVWGVVLVGVALGIALMGVLILVLRTRRSRVSER